MSNKVPANLEYVIRELDWNAKILACFIEEFGLQMIETAGKLADQSYELTQQDHGCLHHANMMRASNEMFVLSLMISALTKIYYRYHRFRFHGERIDI